MSPAASKPAASKPAASAGASASAVTAASAAASATATAEVKDAGGKAIGTATFTQASDGVLVSGTFQGLPAGPHGWHIHAAGKCEPPAFTSAGGHFNPTTKQHGAHNPEGFHVGDLGNIIFPASGSVTIRSIARGGSLGSGANSLLGGPAGSSLVIHAGLDDDETDPAGNSGDRLACGVISASTASTAAKPAASTAASASPPASAKPSGAIGASTAASAKPSAS